MKTPSVIVFDLGKVLVDFDYSIAARRIAPRCNRAVDLPLFNQHASLVIDYELGRLTTRQFVDALIAACGFAGTAREFEEMFSDIFTPIEPMIELHAALRRKGFPTFIFSNTNELQLTHIRRRFPFFKHFDDYILSYEHGAMKPDAKLYEVVERQTKRRGAEILYLDDRPENVHAGEKRGWLAILQESPEKTKIALQKLGVLNSNH